ncbi:hypothetical protein DICVIV_04423 [Dictyocaulus viviparus]|uniref:Uncharacterized protein n=1 Tax=Dictyocaulus viviparus TaxID=29172 RepID=A0A0D8XXN1_DICVI|nr:hypothetical protein DICVIV_04423 [Dictyocaulus viviparus]
MYSKRVTVCWSDIVINRWCSSSYNRDMEVIEQEIELKNAQVAQEEKTAGSNTQPLVDEVIRLEDILNDENLQVTQQQNQLQTEFSPSWKIEEELSEGNMSCHSVAPPSNRESPPPIKNGITASIKTTEALNTRNVKSPKMTKPLQDEKKLLSLRSPTVPLAFAIMAGEVSVELPEPMDMEVKNVEQQPDNDEDSSDSD